MSSSCFVHLGQRCALTTSSASDLFELHVTTVPLGPERLVAYRAACRALGVKALVIELAPGVPVQPMTCAQVGGTLESALEAAQGLAATLEVQGFPSERIKIEAAPWNSRVPVTWEEAAQEPAGRYFEFHARLTVPTGGDLKALAWQCAAWGAHLSRNAFKTRTDGHQERFVTLRSAGVGRTQAQEQAALLVENLERAGWTIGDTVLEYCLYDDHRALDAAWEGP